MGLFGLSPVTPIGGTRLFNRLFSASKTLASAWALRSTKSADGRAATEAAWLDGNNLEKEELQKKKEKMKEKVWHAPAFSWKELTAKM
jgi:hypothetical protein